MSYPEPRYLGDSGQVSALFRPARPQPDTGWSGTDISYVAKQEHTNGEFGLYKLDMGPKAMGATEHFHRTISESFYVLSGEIRLYNGERWVTGGRGDFLYVPAGGLHAFQNDSDEPVSLLLLFTPGAPREEYFEKAAEYAQRSREELKAFRVRHDQYNTDMLDV
ncbi:cupin domain-containing protein [Streptomyces sp. WAC07094]|uniref:cupin domain-containing protein n=1 Tax=Streptomyces sp. WAC07094 TaxID=3072183 RepID=UPI002EBF385C|nr:cupin domain-containing protein [Streptomyces sp. WAC07094]